MYFRIVTNIRKYFVLSINAQKEHFWFGPVNCKWHCNLLPCCLILLSRTRNSVK